MLGSNNYKRISLNVWRPTNQQVGGPIPFSIKMFGKNA